MCDNNEKLAYLGPGYPLFFLFVKYSIAILTTFLIISGCYELYSNYYGTNCSTDPACYDNYAVLLSLANKKNDEDSMAMQLWLNLILVAVLIILIQIMRRHVRMTSIRCDERDISAADYSIMVEHIPKTLEGVDLKKELKEFFENLDPFSDTKDPSKKIRFVVTQVNLTYNLEELYQ